MTGLLIAASILVLFAAVWLFLIFPRRARRIDMTPFDTAVIAHRGMFDAAAGIPENTMPAFRRAADSGYGIETDLHLTRDGEIVLCHDSNLRRIYGADVVIEEHTLAELRQYTATGTEEHLPTFGEFLALVDGRVPLVIELKGSRAQAALAEKAAEFLRAYRGVYCVESFDPFLLHAFSKAMPEVPRGFLSMRFCQAGKRGGSFWAAQCLLYNFYFRPDFIAYEKSGAGRLPLTLVCGLLGCRAVAWTVRTPAERDAAAPHFDTLICENIPALFPDGRHRFR